MLNKVSRVTVLAVAITILAMIIQTVSVEATTKKAPKSAELCSLDNNSAPVVNMKVDFIETHEIQIQTKEEIAEKKAKEEEARQEAIKREREQRLQSTKLYSIESFMFAGRVHWNNKQFTYYSERVLPGGGLRIPGRHTEDGFVKDGDGYIVLASSTKIPKGSIIETPFGIKGKVYDGCEACTVDWFDVYVK